MQVPVWKLYGDYMGLYGGYIGILENKTETTIQGLEIPEMRGPYNKQYNSLRSAGPQSLREIKGPYKNVNFRVWSMIIRNTCKEYPSL